MHRTVEPAILYFGTPVVLVSSENEDGSFNLAPMSSAWWLGWRCLLGFGARSKTPQNMMRTGECVLNLPSADMVEKVNRLAKLTGSNPVPEHKLRMGYRHEPDKFGIAELTPISSEIVTPPRARECPVQMEAVVEATYPLAARDDLDKGKLMAFELRIKRVHIEESILLRGERNRIDPEKWRPLIMSFQHFYGLSSRLYQSTLAEIPEEVYRPASLATAH